MKLRLYLLLAIAALLGEFVGAWLMYEGKVKSTIAERDALRATVTALREGDGSCAVTDDGPRVLCWMEGGAVKVLPLRAGDVVAPRTALRKRRGGAP